MSTISRFPTVFLIMFLAGSVKAGELTHSFVNTDFGGNPLTSSYLLNNATAQNGHKAPTTTPTTTSASSGGTKTTTPTSGEVFAQQLDRLVVNALANRLVEKAIGGGTPIGNKTFNTGLNQVTVDDTGNVTQVTIIDNKTGGKTVIEIPNF